jgi:hypothetical protein
MLQVMHAVFSLMMPSVCTLTELFGVGVAQSQSHKSGVTYGILFERVLLTIGARDSDIF